MHGHVGAEAIDDHADEVCVAVEHHVRFLAREHREVAARVDGHVERGERVLALPLRIRDRDAGHLVDAVMLDARVRGVVRDQIIELVVPHKRKGADPIARTALARNAFFVEIVLPVNERDLAILADRAVDGVDVVEDGFVVRLAAVGDIELTFEKRRLAAARQPRKLFDEPPCLFRGQELRRLHAVHEHLELRGLEHARRQIIPLALADRDRFDVHAVLGERHKIVRHALALGFNAAFLELCDEVQRRHRMQLVRFEQQIPDH